MIAQRRNSLSLQNPTPLSEDLPQETHVKVHVVYTSQVLFFLEVYDIRGTLFGSLLRGDLLFGVLFGGSLYRHIGPIHGSPFDFGK